jgi:hypothetical protein
MNLIRLGLLEPPARLCPPEVQPSSALTITVASQPFRGAHADRNPRMTAADADGA